MILSRDRFNASVRTSAKPGHKEGNGKQKAAMIGDVGRVICAERATFLSKCRTADGYTVNSGPEVCVHVNLSPFAFRARTALQLRWPVAKC